MKRTGKKIKGYMTKYALTQGIEAVTVRASESGDDKYVYVDKRWGPQLIVGKDFFEGRDAAVRAAVEMARKKIQSLKKQLAKAQKLHKEPKWHDGSS